MFPRIWEKDSYVGVDYKSTYSRERNLSGHAVYFPGKEPENSMKLHITRIFGAGWDGHSITPIMKKFCVSEKSMVIPEGIMTDYNLYEFNQESRKFRKEKGSLRICSARGTDRRELQDLRVKGWRSDRIWLSSDDDICRMYSENDQRMSEKSGQTTITTRYRNPFVSKNRWDYCYNILSTIMYHYITRPDGRGISRSVPGRIRLVKLYY